MKTLLILGAGGFIGRAVSTYLENTKEFLVIKQARKNTPGFINCELKSFELRNAIEESDCIINCAGVGLVELASAQENNAKITQSVISALSSVSHTNKRRSYSYVTFAAYEEMLR